MANWWDSDQLAQAPAVTGTDFATAPMPAPQPAPAPAPQAPPPSAAAALAQPQSIFAGLPPEIRAMAGLVGPQQGMQFLSPFLSAPPVEVMGPNGPMFVQRHQAFGMPSPDTIAKFRDLAIKNFNSGVMSGDNGQPMVNPFLPYTLQGQMDLARLGLQSREQQLREAQSPVLLPQPGGGQPAPGAPRPAGAQTAQAGGVNPAYAAVESLKLGQANTEKAYEGLIQGGRDARTALGTVNQLNALLDQINTGRFTGTTTSIKAMAKGLGINLDAMGVRDDVGPAQAAQALSNQLALTLRNPSAGAGMPGALSDADRNFLASMTPNIEGTPEGRRLMVDWARRMYQHQIELTRVANDFMQSGQAATNPRGLQIVLQNYSDAHPIFTSEDAQRIKEMSARPTAAPAAPGGAPSVTLPMPAPAPAQPGAQPQLRYVPGRGIQ